MEELEELGKIWGSMMRRKRRRRGLCQDCLKVVYLPLGDSGDEACGCGGDVCDCPECQDTIWALLAHDFSQGPIKRGLRVWVRGWSPKLGAWWVTGEDGRLL
jgi:hypothetical protein